jgi:serine/threonine-protein kinase
MSEPARAPTRSPLLSRLLEEQRRRWRQGERIAVETLLDQPGLGSDRDVVLDLVYNEILLREEQGDAPRAEDYLRRFPRWADDLALLFEVDRALDERLLSEAAAPVPPIPPEPATALPTLPDYQVLEVLGRGGMGIVYKARHLALNRLVALKMVLAGAHAGPEELARFRTEAEAVARLAHPNIVQVYEIGTRDGRPYMALEFVEGNLARNLAGTPVPARQAAAWLETLARAVQHAHRQGIVHRDLKPANVLVGREGTLKITDFGLAKMVGEHPPGETRSGAILGTPNYMAPEQAEGKARQVGPATDIHGLGAILYELLTGRPPYWGDTTQETLDQVRFQEPVPPSRLQAKVPRDLETICLRCLEKEPERRYPSAEALAEDLGAFLGGEPIRSRPAGRWERLKRRARRRPAEAVLLAAGGMALVGLAVGTLWSNALAAAAVAGLGLLADSCWYSTRLRRALREVSRQQVLAERSVERLHLLLELTRRLIRTTRQEDILRLLAETTARLANAELATIYLLDRQRGELWSKVTLDQGVGEIRLPLGVGIAGTVALTGEAINIANAYADARFNPEIDRRTGHKTRNLLTVPMLAADGRMLGVFQVINKLDGTFGVEDVGILSSLAASAALAIELAPGGSGRGAGAIAGSAPTRRAPPSVDG